jgi:multiple sugar transport system permease protein
MSSEQYTVHKDGILTPRQLKKARRIVIRVLLVGVSLFYIFPLYWMVITSFKGGTEAYTLPATYVPHNFSIDAYIRVLVESNFVTFYINSVIVAIGTIALTNLAAILAGYGLARLEFPFQKSFARSILFGYMFPPLLLGIPIYLIWDTIGLANTLGGLILAQVSLTIPFCTWVMWRFFLSIDTSYEESAWMAGASRMRAFFEIALPYAKPGIIAITIFAFAVSWGDFTLALILLTDIQKQTLPIGILAFVQQNTVEWDAVMAGVFLISIPPLVVVYSLQQYILRGFSLE